MVVNLVTREIVTNRVDIAMMMVKLDRIAVSRKEREFAGKRDRTALINA